MGILKAQGFKNLDYDGKIIFKGEVKFVIRMNNFFYLILFLFFFQMQILKVMLKQVIV